MRCSVGVVVSMVVRRRGRDHDITASCLLLRRRDVEIPNLVSICIPGGIGHARPDRFGVLCMR